MISAWHLAWIIPAAFAFGYVLLAFMLGCRHDD